MTQCPDRSAAYSILPTHSVHFGECVQMGGIIHIGTLCLKQVYNSPIQWNYDCQKKPQQSVFPDTVYLLLVFWTGNWEYKYCVFELFGDVWLFWLYLCKESWMNPSSIWNILWWILVAPALAQKAKNRTILMGHTFFLYIPSSVGTATRCLGKPWHPPTKRSPPPHTHTHTHNQAAHHSAQALFHKPPCWLDQSERSLPPPPWDCHHLFDTMIWDCALRSWPETTIHHHDASALCKPPWHHRAEGTPEVLAKSERISNTHTNTHTFSLTHMFYRLT